MRKIEKIRISNNTMEKKGKYRHEALCGIFSTEATKDELVEDYLKDKYQF